MPHPAVAGFIQLTDPGQATPGMRQALVGCWVEVANAGGAVGFPFPPVGAEEVGTVADRLIADLDPGYNRIAVAEADGVLAGWLNLEQLRLEARGGQGLEGFYSRLGWKEIGRWPGALRFPDGDRDEVLMLLAPL